MSLALFNQDAVEAERAFNTLCLVKAEGNSFMQGSLLVVDSEGKEWHNYCIEIHHSDRYPNMFPTVFETGGVIPRIADWHINVDGSCCLDNEFNQQIKCFNGLSLLTFIESEVIPWLANQSYRRVTGNYINGEQGHGDIGRIEFFIKELNAPNLLTCVEWMVKLAEYEAIPRQAMCFCGSGNKWRHCHKIAFERLHTISKSLLWWAIDRFFKYIKEGRPMLLELQKHTSVNILS